MSDDHSQRNQAPASQQHLRQVEKNLNDLVQLLRNQREVLKQRGMSLPSGTLDNLKSIKPRLDEVSNQLADTVVELQRLRALADTTALINSSLETDAVLNQVMDTVVNLSGAERGYIVLKNRDTGDFDQFRVARGIDLDAAMQSQNSEGNSVKRSEFIVSHTIVNDVASTGEAVITDNASQDDRYRSQQSIVGFALRSIMAVPLTVRGEVIGVVYCDNRIMTGVFQTDELEMIKAFSDQAAVAIENARLFERVRAQLQQLTEMRDLMDNVFDSIANGVITLEPNGKVSTINAAARHILKLAEDGEWIGKRLEDILPQMDESFNKTLDAVRADGQQRMMEIDVTLANDSVRNWNLIVSSLRDADGQTQGLALVLDDLTERKQREAQLVELRRYLPGALVDKVGDVDNIDVQGQERTITVIATDVRGFTTFSEMLPPDQLMEIINRYLSLASDGINLYEGIVDRYEGDAVTGLFNTQLNPQEDHAVRAVRAAMSIIYDLYALHEIMPEEQQLYYGIGIHTGPAYLGNVGSPDRQEFAALGEANSVAKMLEANAGAGEIIISEATYEQVKDFFECEPRKPEKTAGRYTLERIYKVLKRRKGVNTGQLIVDPELAELLADLDGDDDG